MFAMYIGLPVNAASEIIELESQVTTIFSEIANADKYAFLSTLSTTVCLSPKKKFSFFNYTFWCSH